MRPTSARAERTPTVWSGRDLKPTHLRSRGENGRQAVGVDAEADPPPLARRERQAGQRQGLRWRPTSARAERTRRRPSSTRAATTHLRSRGENHPSRARSCRWTDPPPLARREPVPDLEQQIAQRPTSARAERTRSATASWRCSATHLRSRGENETVTQIRVMAVDPPPLARRERSRCRGRWWCPRPTSARAERTGAKAVAFTGAPTHLRSRGENRCPHSSLRSTGDPPPLARREPPSNASASYGPRPTSARAERTLTARSAAAAAATHLRSRGENPS